MHELCMVTGVGIISAELKICNKICLLNQYDIKKGISAEERFFA